MLSEKRTRKPPETFAVVEQKQPRKDKQVEKKRKVSGCNYELIPVPEKFQDPGETYLLYGVILLSSYLSTFNSNSLPQPLVNFSKELSV